MSCSSITEGGPHATYRSLNQTKWHSQYHVVFIPKYRKKAIYGGLREQLGEVLRQLAQHIERVG